MAALNVTPVPVGAGLADLAGAAVAATALGDTAPVGPGRFLAVFNGDASSHTATVVTPGNADGHAIADGTLTVAAGKTGLLPLHNIYRGATGRAAITYDAVTSVTVAVIELAT